MRRREKRGKDDEVSLTLKSLLSRRSIFQEQREPVNCLTELAFMEREERGTDWEQAFRTRLRRSGKQARRKENGLSAPNPRR